MGVLVATLLLMVSPPGCCCQPCVGATMLPNSSVAPAVGRGVSVGADQALSGSFDTSGLTVLSLPLRVSMMTTAAISTTTMTSATLTVMMRFLFFSPSSSSSSSISSSSSAASSSRSGSSASEPSALSAAASSLSGTAATGAAAFLRRSTTYSVPFSSKLAMAFEGSSADSAFLRVSSRPAANSPSMPGSGTRSLLPSARMATPRGRYSRMRSARSLRRS